jgi:hypothetical protein
MEPDEVRAEIERRKKRAADLQIREILMSLYNSHLARYESWIREDSELVYPGISDTVQFSGKDIQFSLGKTVYRLTYKEGPAPKSERIHGGYGEFFEEKIVPATLGLRVDEQRVFKFEMSRCTTYTQNRPFWKDSLGEVTRFIDGMWVLEITDLLENIRTHEQGIREKRDGPRLEALKKRFGL